MMYTLITGNPVDGFTFYGPYMNYDQAADSAELLDEDWWIAPLNNHIITKGSNND